MYLLILFSETQAKGLMIFHGCLYEMVTSLDPRIIVVFPLGQELRLCGLHLANMILGVHCFKSLSMQNAERR